MLAVLAAAFGAAAGAQTPAAAVAQPAVATRRNSSMPETRLRRRYVPSVTRKKNRSAVHARFIRA